MNITYPLLDSSRFSRERSIRLLDAFEHHKCDCYSNAVQAWEQLVDLALDSDDQELINQRQSWWYCQGWWIRQYRDGSGHDAVTHGWLMDGTSVLDGTSLLYPVLGESFWQPVQVWTWDELQDERMVATAWPLGWLPDEPELEERGNYQAALDVALLSISTEGNS